MIDLQDIKRLLGSTDTLSLYLNVDNAVRENQAVNPAWKIELKNALRKIEDGLSADQRGSWKAVQQRVERFFRDYRPQSKGLALFITPDDEQRFDLPVTTENRATFGEPLVAPLVWKLDEFEPYLVLMVDQEEANLYFSYLGSTEFEEGMEIDLSEYDFPRNYLMPSASAITGGHMLTQGSQRDRFEDRLDEYRARFYRNVVDAARRVSSERQARRIILGGSEQAVHAVRHEMDDDLRARVVHVMSIPMQSSPHEIFRHIQPVALAYEREDEEALVKEIIDFAKSGGRGALGREAVEKALAMQQVELLVMSWPGVDEALANQLSHQALALNTEIELVHGPAAERLNQEGGIGARLYYRV
jgi:hypothetical protein